MASISITNKRCTLQILKFIRTFKCGNGKSSNNFSYKSSRNRNRLQSQYTIHWIVFSHFTSIHHNAKHWMLIYVCVLIEFQLSVHGVLLSPNASVIPIRYTLLYIAVHLYKVTITLNYHFVSTLCIRLLNQHIQSFEFGWW